MSRAFVWDSGDSWDDPDLVWDGPAVPEGSKMSQDNKKSVVVSAAEVAAIKAQIDVLLGLMPWRDSIPAGDKSQYTVIGTKRAGMDGTFINHMTARPDLVPSYVDMAEVSKDLAFRQALAEIRAYLSPVVEGIDDAETLASSDSYNAYSAFKHSVDTAAKRSVVGTDTIKSELDVYFPGGRRSSTPTPPA